jgi:hypothetical protein
MRILLREGAEVRGYDPVSMGVAARMMPNVRSMCGSPYDLAEGSDAVVLMTEWNEFKHLDLARLRGSCARRWSSTGATSTSRRRCGKPDSCIAGSAGDTITIALNSFSGAADHE